jgi:hypothetical protein
MNAGTCWGKNTIGMRGRGVERLRKATLTLRLGEGVSFLNQPPYYFNLSGRDVTSGDKPAASLLVSDI